MASLNQCNFIGNVGKLETRYLPNGDAVTNVSIAVNETWKDKDGNKQDRTEWVNIVFYKKLAEIVGEYVKVGQSLFVSGSMRTRSWEKDGVTRYTTEIIADQMQMLGSKAQSNDADDTSTPSAKNNAPKTYAGMSETEFDEQIPF